MSYWCNYCSFFPPFFSHRLGSKDKIQNVTPMGGPISRRRPIRIGGPIGGPGRPLDKAGPLGRGGAALIQREWGRPLCDKVGRRGPGGGRLSGGRGRPAVRTQAAGGRPLALSRWIRGAAGADQAPAPGGAPARRPAYGAIWGRIRRGAPRLWCNWGPAGGPGRRRGRGPGP